jgi:hypothetical protein
MKSNDPLVLLTMDGVDAVRDRLSIFVQNDRAVNNYDNSVSGGQNWRVVFKGITFLVAVTSKPSEISSFERVFCKSSLAIAQASVVIGFDENVAGGERIAPITATLLEFGAYLSGPLGADTVAWMPAQIMSDSEYFAEAVSDYLNGGVFPCLALVRFSFSGGDESVRTSGLNWFCGQELELKCSGIDRPSIMRRMVRIVHDMAVNGPINSDETVPDLDGEGKLQLSPTPDGTVVVGEIRSDLDVVRL